MKKKKVLIVGGYGTVGRELTRILAHFRKFDLVLAGRSENKAQELARIYNCESKQFDILNKESFPGHLFGIDLVINCFSGPFTNSPLHLPEYCAENAIHYIDVAGSFEYNERFLTLNEKAQKNNSILITALGANPGVPGILIMKSAQNFEKIQSVKIYFVIGSKLDGVSAAGLKELRYLLETRPLIWKKGIWKDPEIKSIREWIGSPFQKEIYLGPSITKDLLLIPGLVNLDELSFYSGSQSDLQGLFMILGLKIGMTNTDFGTNLLLKFLKKLGKGKGANSDILIQIQIQGIQDSKPVLNQYRLVADENFVTAITPAIVADFILEGKIQKTGAFVPPQIVPGDEFFEVLKRFPITIQFESGESVLKEK